MVVDCIAIVCVIDNDIDNEIVVKNYVMHHWHSHMLRWAHKI